MAVKPAAKLSRIPPFPSLASRALGTYNSMAHTFGTHMGGADVATPGTFNTEINALADNVRDNALEAQTQAQAAGAASQAAQEARSGAQIQREGAQVARQAAEAAHAALLALDALWLGAAAANPATGKGGAALVAGNAYVNTISGTLRAYNGQAWVEGISTVAGVSSVNSRQGAVELPRTLDYDARSALRTDEYSGHALIQGLGWFCWQAGSDEPDDDESCFATSTGRWLLTCPHWDVVTDWQLPDDDERDGRISEAENRISALEMFGSPDPAGRATILEARATRLEGLVRHGTATCAITSVAAVTSVTFAGTVAGAAVGDRVLITTPAQLGNSAADTGRLSCHAYVSAADTITVVLCNASAAAATTHPAVRAAWPITVFKEI